LRKDQPQPTALQHRSHASLDLSQGAAAWSGLADTYALEGMTDHHALEVAEKCHAAAVKALELDPLLPEAHNAMAAWYLFYAWDPVRAEAEVRRGIELDPNYSELHHLLSYILEVQKRYAEGEVEAKRMVEIEPYVFSWELASYYMGERKFDDALRELKLQSSAYPGSADIADALAKAYWLKGMYKEWEEQIELSLEFQRDLKGKVEVHKAWLTGGRDAVARWHANRARKLDIEAELVASIVAYTRDKEETLKLLEASYRNHDPDLIFIQNEPVMNFLHSEPRYQALVKKLGLPPAW
jgi:hypothetical protein